MVTSSPTFIALVLLTNANLSMTRDVGPGNKQSELVKKAEEINFDEYSRPKPEYHPFSLNCLLFKDVGCDIECFALINAFGILGGGVCDKNDVCSCSYAQDPTFVGSWKMKFSSTEKLLDEIIDDKKLFHPIDQLLNTPFSTGLEIKEKLKEYLLPAQYDQVDVIGSYPAAKMNPNPNEISTIKMENYVDKILAEELKYISNKELSTIDVEKALNRGLKGMIQDSEKLTLLISEIRRIDNTFMNDILNSFMKNNRISLNDQTANNHISNVADAISKSIINKLVAKVGKTSFQYYVNWIGEKFTYVFTLKFLSSKPVKPVEDMEEASKIPNFYVLPSAVDRELFKKQIAIDDTWRGDNYKLRYRRDENSKNINLTWIKKPVMVSILKTTQWVSQNWIFGEVGIYLSRTARIQKAENWDFGETTNEYRKFFFSNGDAYSKRQWGGKIDVKILKMHKAYITNWCQQNEYLITNLYCDILEI